MRRISILLIITFFLGCSHLDTIIGKWTVEKVSLGFDEKHNTPEMIQQIGEQEMNNSLIFKNDSIVNIVMVDMNGDYIYHINEKEISVGNMKIGTWENGKITSKMMTPVGEMTVIYKRDF